MLYHLVTSTNIEGACHSTGVKTIQNLKGVVPLTQTNKRHKNNFSYVTKVILIGVYNFLGDLYCSNYLTRTNMGPVRKADCLHRFKIFITQSFDRWHMTLSRKPFQIIPSWLEYVQPKVVLDC